MAGVGADKQLASGVVVGSSNESPALLRGWRTT